MSEEATMKDQMSKESTMKITITASEEAADKDREIARLREEKKALEARLDMQSRHRRLALAGQSKIAERLSNLASCEIPIEALAPLLKVLTDLEKSTWADD